MFQSIIEQFPSSEQTGIKVLAFDQGGIYIGVDYAATVKYFKELGVTNAHDLYTQKKQTPEIDLFEQGKISDAEFYQYLRRNLTGLKPEITDAQLYEGWNAMLTGVIPGVLEFIRELRALGYIVIVVSNADSIHHLGVRDQLREAGVMHLFDTESFDATFISYQIGFNKPSVAIFYEVFRRLQERFGSIKIEPKDILFLDDSEKHIVGRDETEGAVRAGWLGLLVPSNSSVNVLAGYLLSALKEKASELAY